MEEAQRKSTTRCGGNHGAMSTSREESCEKEKKRKNQEEASAFHSIGRSKSDVMESGEKTDHTAEAEKNHDEVQGAR